jgi:choline dehydrogenase
LHPARSFARPNLTELSRAVVTKLLFNGRRATGVQYLHNGIIEQAYAGAEIIVAASALRSPQLLMLSGVGPAREPEELGVEVQHDAPVIMIAEKAADLIRHQT